MGQPTLNTFVTKPTEEKTENGGTLRSIRLRVDLPLVAAVLGLCAFGMIMIYSASTGYTVTQDVPVDYYLRRQALWMVISVAAAVVVSFIDYHWYNKLAVWMMAGTVILLAVVFIFGVFQLGAQRSLFGGSVRPSELAKVVTIIYVSVWLNARRDDLDEFFMGLFPLLVILGIAIALIIFQPDLSAAITVFVLGGLLFYLAGGNFRQVALMLLVIALVGLLMVQFSSTGKQRVTDFFNGIQNPLAASDQVQHTLKAVINGGVFGTGITHGPSKFEGLPTSITDSIFAIVAEEVGLVGSAMLMAAYFVILWRSLMIAARAPDLLGRLLAGGFGLWVLIEALLNIGVAVALLPQAGNALPFISAGGSNLLVNMIGIGIIMNVARVSEKKRVEGRPVSAVVNLRGRDRRGSVPRFVRPTSPRE